MKNKVNEVKGCLYQNGNYWACKFRVWNEETQKYKQITRSTGIRVDNVSNRKLVLSENKARKVMDELISKYQHTTYCGDMLFAEFINVWLKEHTAELQTTTAYQYTKMYEKHIKPYWEQKQISLRDLEVDDLNNFYRYKEMMGLSPNTVTKFHTMLHTALKYACNHRYVKYNVATCAKLPKKKRPKYNYYTVEEMKQLLKVVKGTSIEVPVTLACVLGLRRSEIVGLRWSAIDFKRREIHIVGKVINYHGNDSSDRYQYSTTMKTDASEAYFPMTDTLYHYLQNLYNTQKNMLRTTEKYVDYVCVNDVGELIKPDYITDRFSKLLANNNMRHIRFHDLRHSCISLLNYEKFTMKDLQCYARHENMATTQNFYAHTYDDTKLKMQSAICKNIFGE